MKRKLRIFSNIAIICLSVCMFAFGVYAASTVSVTTEGTVTFDASGVYAEVTRTITGVKNPPASSSVLIDASTTEGTPISMNSDLEFETADSLVEIKFDIRNKAAETETNRNIYVTVTEGNTLPKVNNNVVKTVEHLDAEFVISPNTTRSFSIYLSVKDVNASATANYDYVVSLKNATQGTVLTDSTATFTASGNEYTVSNVTSTASHITVPETYNGKPVTAIGDNAFYGVRSTLNKVTFPNSITSISASALTDCNKVIAIGLPKDISDSNVFVALKCTGIKTVVIPENITSIPANTDYSSYNNIDAIIIPSSITKFCDNAFYGISTTDYGTRQVIYKGSLSEWMNISYENGEYSYSENTAPTYNGGELYINGQRLSSVEFRNNVTKSSFMYNYQLNNVTIKDGVTEIADYAFAYCLNVTITIPTSVTKLGYYSLANCKIVIYEGTYEQFKQIQGSSDAFYYMDYETLICDGVVCDTDF